MFSKKSVNILLDLRLFKLTLRLTTEPKNSGIFSTINHFHIKINIDCLSFSIVTGCQFSRQNINLPPLQIFISRTSRAICVNAGTAATDDYKGLCKVKTIPKIRVRTMEMGGFRSQSEKKYLKNRPKIVPHQY